MRSMAAFYIRYINPTRSSFLQVPISRTDGRVDLNVISEQGGADRANLNVLEESLTTSCTLANQRLVATAGL